MSERRVRAVRGTAAAAVAVFFASTAHTLSGGSAPPLWLIVAVTVLAAPVCVALVGRRRNLPRLAASVVLAQAALHAAFAAVGTAAPAALHGAHHHSLAFLDGAAAVDPAAAAMTAGHALAALVTIVVLAYGERLIAAVSRGIRRLLRLAPVAGHSPVTVGVVANPHRGAITAPFLECAPRRGPPTSLVSTIAV